MSTTAEKTKPRTNANKTRRNNKASLYERQNVHKYPSPNDYSRDDEGFTDVDRLIDAFGRFGN